MCGGTGTTLKGKSYESYLNGLIGSINIATNQDGALISVMIAENKEYFGISTGAYVVIPVKV